MANRIHWAFDGTIFYRYNAVTSLKTLINWSGYLNPKYVIDADLLSNSNVGWDGQMLFNFPNTIQVSKVGLKLMNGASWCNLDFKVSNDSTDGFDGSWTTLVSAQNYPTAYAYQEFTGWSLVDAKWLKVCRNATTETIPTPVSIFIFGEYQSALFEFWDSSESAPVTGDYPLSLADVPNDANYTDTFSFKVKNADTDAHTYSLTLRPTRYTDVRGYSVDDTVIQEDFFLSDDAGVTKESSIQTASVVAAAFSDMITVYGDVLKMNNPGDGKHYFWVDCVQDIPITDDIFEAGTQQDLKSGGDGAKSYGWNVLNSANATTMTVNTTNAGKMTLICNATNSVSVGSTFTGPFAFQEVQGNFDIEAYISSYSGNTNYNSCGLIVRDPNGNNGSPAQLSIKVGLRYNGSWKSVNESTPYGGLSRDESSTIYPYIRIKRVGYDFFVYAKVNAGDAWIAMRDPTNTTRYYWRRPDFLPSIQIGLIVSSENTSANMNAQFDYFRVTV